MISSPKTFLINSGPLIVGVKGVKKEFLGEFERKYSPFFVERGNPDFTLEVFEKDEQFLGNENGLLKLEEKVEDGNKVLLSNFAKGYEIDRNGTSMVFIQKNVNSVSYFTSLENHFRWVFSYRILKDGGFLLHSSSFIKNDKAHLFIGDSGDGKSTVAEFARNAGHKILSDDLNIIFKKGDEYYATSSPFYGQMSQEEKCKESYKVGSCYRLRKNSENRLKKMSIAESLVVFIPCCVFIDDKKIRNENLISSVIEFMRKVPSFELFFKKEETFLDLIE
jgi:hypothetical protein